MDFSHGVVFKPSKPEKVYKLDELSGYNYVRIYWVDLVNVRRCRLVPIKYFKQLVESNRPGVNIAKVGLALIYLITPPGFSSVGEYLYALDLSTLRPLSFAPGHLGVLGYAEEKTPIVSSTSGEKSVEVDICPRTLLKRIVEDAQKNCNIEFLVGFETEFVLLSSTNPVTPSNIHQWSGSGGFLTGSKESIILEEIGESMQKSGLSFQMIHSEAAPGQYEVVSGPLSPLDAADQVVFTRELIVNIAAKHGLHATFAPRPFMTSAGSAAHVHISVHSRSSDAPKKPIERMSRDEESFLAGVLDHLQAIPAITLPTPASYKRMADGVWSGGTFVHYGTENREAPVRLTNATSPESRNFEMRYVDATANPHLALGAIIGAGLTGLKAKAKLTMRDCPGPKCAWEMTENERLGFGIRKRMPLGIEEARMYLLQDEVMMRILGEEFVEKYLSVNRTLEKALLQEEDENAQLTRLVEFY